MRHVVRRPALIVGLICLLVRVNLVKDCFPLAYRLSAPVGAVLIAASMGHFRAPVDDPTHADASPLFGTDER